MLPSKLESIIEERINRQFATTPAEAETLASEDIEPATWGRFVVQTARDEELPVDTVEMLFVSLGGPSEAFDGLKNAIEDYQDELCD